MAHTKHQELKLSSQENRRRRLMVPDSNHFHAGKDARRRGLPREIPDCRLTSASRQEWYDGWDYQNEQMRPPPTDEQRAQHNAFCKGLIDHLNSM